MAGVFNIIPKGGTTITCAFGDSESIPYNIVAADFNEAEREKVLYSEGKLGGSVAGINHGIVEITLVFAVGGTSENDAASNARVLNTALRNREGGLIEYRPREYDSTVTNTFYRYLKAGASRRISKKTLIPTERHITGELHEFTVTTFAWATSDPNNFETIVAETGLFNHDDAGHNNYVDILASNIEGDVFFPIVKVRLDVGASETSQLLIVHKRPMRIGAHTNLDWTECEDMSGLGADVIDAAASNGEYATLDSVSPGLSNTQPTEWDSTYLGNTSPIVAMRVAPGDDGIWKVEVQLGIASSGILQTSNLDIGTWGYLVSASEWGVYYQFNELTIPPFSIQQHITDTSTPDISTYMENVWWKLYLERLSGTGDLHIDWILMARADDWLNVFRAPSEFGVLSGPSTTYLEIDAISGSVFVKVPPSDSVVVLWENTGSSISDLIFRSDEDTRLRFILPGSPSFPYTPLLEFFVTVTGIHGTIYPFET